MIGTDLEGMRDVLSSSNSSKSHLGRCWSRVSRYALFMRPLSERMWDFGNGKRTNCNILVSATQDVI